MITKVFEEFFGVMLGDGILLILFMCSLFTVAGIAFAVGDWFDNRGR